MLASYLERGPLMWMMPLHLHLIQKSDYDDMTAVKNPMKLEWCPYHSCFSRVEAPKSGSRLPKAVQGTASKVRLGGKEPLK